MSAETITGLIVLATMLGIGLFAAVRTSRK
jgi:hypothetical protein